MSWVLDGYLIGRAAGGRMKSHKCCICGILCRIAVLDGYLIGSETRGLNQEFYRELLLELVREHGPVSRPEIDNLLLEKLPEILTQKQKKTKIHNLIQEQSREGRIQNIGGRGLSSRWVLMEEQFDKSLKNNHD